MKASREELIDFISWYNDQPYEIRRQLMYPEIVDLYLKSINSEAGNETPTVTDNEDQEEIFCSCYPGPKLPDEKYRTGKYRCQWCFRPIEQNID